MVPRRLGLPRRLRWRCSRTETHSNLLLGRPAFRHASGLDRPSERALKIKRHAARVSEPLPGSILPNFLIIGAVKAGTTSLYHYLNPHPQVFMSTPKELHFFVEEWNWPLGWDWYQGHFAEAGHAAAIGEASVTYTQYPTYRGIPKRIAQHLPETRLIYVVREPVDRIRSEYVHRVLIGKERDPVEKAVLENPRYVNHSRYSVQIDQYLEHFPQEQLLVIMAERLRTDREATVQRVARFLGIDPDWSWSSLDQEFYRSDERREFPPLLNRLRAIPAVRRVARFIPRHIKEAGLRPAHKLLPPEMGVISTSLRCQLEERLQGDVQRLRTYLGEGFDGWGIE